MFETENKLESIRDDELSQKMRLVFYMQSGKFEQVLNLFLS